MLNYVKTSRLSTSGDICHTKEVERSPLKKKFKESCSISKSELDGAIAAAVKMAMAEQRSDLDKIVTTAVKTAIDDMLVPQLASLSSELKHTVVAVTTITSRTENLEKTVERIQSKCDLTQAAARSDRDQLTALQLKFDNLAAKMTDIEDRNRRSNVRLVGLKESEEGDNCIAFLRANLSKWIPSLAGREIKIERAHRIYSGKNTTHPRTVVFKLLDYTDRQAILKGARAASPVKHGGSSLLFFPDYSHETTRKRKAFADVRKKLDNLGIQSFLLFPATLKITYGGRQILLRSPDEAEKFLLSIQPPTGTSAEDQANVLYTLQEVSNETSFRPML
uniref:L1 transposable element RRM domain-containing protein n=1 Tax=Astyanax mexicanus TaxID=7994 RepID=A0A3B1KFW0_ASTMX